MKVIVIVDEFSNKEKLENLIKYLNENKIEAIAHSNVKPTVMTLEMLPKLEPMIYHPQSHYDELPQKQKHRKKRKFHN